MRLGHAGILAVVLTSAIAASAVAGDSAPTVNSDSLRAEASRAMSAGSYADAAKKLNIVLAHESRNQEARFELAEAYLAMGRLHAARRHFRLALSGNPENADWVARCRVEIGRSWEKAGEYREALSEYQLALQIKPSYSEAESGRTRALAQVGN
jgi:tetratricopeptide (TPR) repeat protein